jgi:hypothetical protein
LALFLAGIYASKSCLGELSERVLRGPFAYADFVGESLKRDPFTLFSRPIVFANK